MAKRWISWILCLTLLVGLAGCGDGIQQPDTTQPMHTTEQGESLAPTKETAGETQAEDFDVADEQDSKMDFSKYEEKKTKNSEKSTDAPSEQGEAQPETGTQKPAPGGSQSNQGVCYITISCEEILDNMDMLAPGREAFVPENGVILATSEVPFEKGETVFDILKRVTSDCGIQMEFSYFPIYESMYIEGIGNLYEKDCGSGSGWLYYVNGVKPNYGVSKYVLEDQDMVEFYYTCG